MKREKSCGAVIYRRNEGRVEVLLIRHKNGGHWAFPKGHVEKQETEKETAKREIREETGLKVKLETGFRESVTYSPKPNVMKDVIYFAARVESGKTKAQPEEVLDIRWEDEEHAMELVTFSNDREILRSFFRYLQAREQEPEE